MPRISRSEKAKRTLQASLAASARRLQKLGYKTSVRVAKNRDGSVDGEIAITKGKRSMRRFSIEVQEAVKLRAGFKVGFAARFSPPERTRVPAMFQELLLKYKQKQRLTVTVRTHKWHSREHAKSRVPIAAETIRKVVRDFQKHHKVPLKTVHLRVRWNSPKKRKDK